MSNKSSWAMLFYLRIKNNMDSPAKIALDDIKAFTSNEKTKVFSEDMMGSTCFGFLKGMSKELTIAPGKTSVFAIFVLLDKRIQAKDLILKYKEKPVPFVLKKPLVYENSSVYSIPYLVSTKNPLKGQTTLAHYLPPSFSKNKDISITRIEFNELKIKNAFAFYLQEKRYLVVILEVKPLIRNQQCEQYQVISLPGLLWQDRFIVPSNKKIEIGENLSFRLMNSNSIMQFDDKIQSDWRALIYEIPGRMKADEITLGFPHCHMKVQCVNEEMIDFLPKGCIFSQKWADRDGTDARRDARRRDGAIH